MRLIIDIQYFPSIILYKNLYKYSDIIFDQYETYQKMGFRNRCQIAGAQGVVDLSVPLVEGRGQKKFVRDVRISDRQPWAARHWKTIVSCYSRSPWFEFHRDGLDDLYRRRWEFLLDWDLACFDWSLRALGLVVPVRLTEKWVRVYSPGEDEDWRGRLVPKERESLGEVVSGVGVADDDGGVVRYRQVFDERTGFIPNLSVLDLLFCEGVAARERLGG
jgi:WbqC-like protein family